MACNSCRNLELEYKAHDIFSTVQFADLCKTAKSGCSSCALLRDGILSFIGPEDADIVHLIQDIESRRDSRLGRRNPLLIKVIAQDQNAPKTTLDFYTDDLRVSHKWPLVPIASHISADSSTLGCFDHARKWLDTCVSSHSQCCLSPAPNPLPTRVIAVGSSSQILRLHESSPGENSPYAALSYCWGTVRAFTTTASTYASRKSGFALSDLPKTCADAVVAARRLGIEYLWIDSLCIIQDSAEDWETEAARMCGVYEGAVVTFAGIDSADMDAGLFVSAPGRETIELDVNLGKGLDGKVFVRRTRNTGSVCFSHTITSPSLRPGNGMEYGVLDTRGWTLQELTLSPRILWFSAWELAWSCACATACECDPEMTGDWLTDSTKRPKLTASPGMDWLKMWRDLVLMYTKRRLTYDTDRLPAIAGLAAAMQRNLNSKYFCGLWEVDLKRQLLWGSVFERGSPGSSASRAPIPHNGGIGVEYAPSWSWASVTDVTIFIDTALRPRFRFLWKIIDVEFMSSGTNEFGPGQGAITIQGPVIPIKVERGYFVYNPPLSDPNTLGQKLCDAKDSWLPDQRLEYRDIESVSGKELIFLSAGGLTKEGRNEFTGFIGLVLEKVGSEAYKRVGLVEGRFKTKECEDSWDDWEERATWNKIVLI